MCIYTYIHIYNVRTTPALRRRVNKWFICLCFCHEDRIVTTAHAGRGSVGSMLLSSNTNTPNTRRPHDAGPPHAHKIC